VTRFVREGVRALVLDEDDRVLLVRMVEPQTGDQWWVTPGGGVDPDEEAPQALRRELREETGLEEFELGPAIWTRRDVFPWGGRTLDQRERIFLVRVASFEPRPLLSKTQLASEGVHELRWWTLAELVDSDANFAPTRIVRFLRQLLEEGPPEAPIDVGV
jgi:8-oxo-dGTP pyrophosphatase MutT (NUDIX family)